MSIECKSIKMVVFSISMVPLMDDFVRTSALQIFEYVTNVVEHVPKSTEC